LICYQDIISITGSTQDLEIKTLV